MGVIFKQKSKSNKLTQEKLKTYLWYNPDNGLFFWRNRITIGKHAGSPNNNGYMVIGIEGKSYFAHHLAYLYQTGTFPTDEVTFRNNRRDDVSWENLRLRSTAQRNRERKMPSNKSGVRGVYQTKSGNWIARIKINGELLNLGVHKTILWAAIARLKAEIEYNFYPNIASNSAYSFVYKHKPKLAIRLVQLIAPECF